LLSLQAALLLLLLRPVVTDGTARHGADHGMMARDMPGHGADRGALDAAAGVRRLYGGHGQKGRQWHQETQVGLVSHD
jgi:hypothetical protein